MEGQRATSPSSGEDATSSSPTIPIFNHDASTAPDNFPSATDDKPMGRQKRKRTSPEDQAVLEAYYAHDAKPDKAARLDLVKKVSLGEKEVQIWFQNRRQSSRRKSRPLLPHEIAQYQLSKSAATPDPLSSGSNPNIPREQPHGGHPASSTRGQHPAGAHGVGEAEGRVGQIQWSGSSTSPFETPAAPDEQAAASATGTSRTGQIGPDAPRERAALVPVFTAGVVASNYPPEQRSSQHVDDGLARTGSSSLHGHSARPRSPRRVRKSSSFVRLSMNSDGGAQIVAKDDSSPSPPRPAAYSQLDGANDPVSAIGLPGVSRSNTDTAPALHRAPSGRSRDSRAWEFWCDKDGRSELEVKAEKDQSGSAADAIQLLRSASGRSILGSLPTNRNPGQPSAAKRLRREARMPLQRSSTSNGRLQGKKLADCLGKRAPRLSASKSALSVYIPGNSSDKENWSPRSDLQSESAAEEDEAGAAKQDRQTSRHPGSKSRRHRGSIDPENDPEIAAFMRAGRESDKVSDHEELDCVQGLLSLSQGNWR